MRDSNSRKTLKFSRNSEQEPFALRSKFSHRKSSQSRDNQSLPLEILKNLAKKASFSAGYPGDLTKKTSTTMENPGILAKKTSSSVGNPRILAKRASFFAGDPENLVKRALTSAGNLGILEKTVPLSATYAVYEEDLSWNLPPILQDFSQKSILHPPIAIVISRQGAQCP